MPACDWLRDDTNIGARVRDSLVAGVSTRRYAAGGQTNCRQPPTASCGARAGAPRAFRDANLALRWSAAGFLEAEKSFRRIQGIKDLWILKAELKRPDKQVHVDQQKKAT